MHAGLCEVQMFTEVNCLELSSDYIVSPLQMRLQGANFKDANVHAATVCQLLCCVTVLSRCCPVRLKVSSLFFVFVFCVSFV